jgi:predicted nuclease of predicted toxin-antitoxin system
MRFLVDECTGPGLAAWLRDQGHEVFSVYDEARGIDDDAVLRLAHDQNRIIITNDKDFGEKVFREKMAHKGVVLLRLDDERTPNKIAVLQRVLAGYADQLPDRFVVVTEKAVRIVGPS